MRRRLLLLGLVLLTTLVGHSAWSVYHKEQESRVLRTEAESQLASLEAREARLRGDIARLKSERGVEEALRAEYELGESGEEVLVIVEPPAPPPEPKPRESVWQKALPWW
jgi:cell division protein FtsB